MSPSAMMRPALRAPAGTLRQVIFRRFESTAANKAAEKATEAGKDAAAKAKELQAKALEGLSKVSSAAGPAIAGAAKGLTSALGKAGGRTGRLIGTVEKHTPLAVYYGKVGAETAKLVFNAQKMSPPSVQTFQSYYEALWKSLKSGTLIQSPQQLIQQARNLSNAQLAAGGVVLAECLGFFTVGEIIGRFKLVGYRGESGAHH